MNKIEAKIVVVGDSSIGKTTCIHRFTTGVYDDTLVATIGVEYKCNTVYNDKGPVLFKIWDIAGQDRFKSIIPSVFKGVDIVIYMFDIQNKNSFDSIAENWIPSVKEHVNNPNLITLLVANKCECPLIDRKILNTDIKHLIRDHDFEKSNYYEISAKNGLNIKQMFKTLSIQYMQIHDKILLNSIDKDFIISSLEDDNYHKKNNDKIKKKLFCIV